MNTIYTKAIIYCRVSTKKQEQEGGGLGSQEIRCQEYANSQGYTIDAVFQDAYSGGGDFMKRPAMRDLLAYVDEHAQDNYVVIFDDLKRFARDLKFHWELRAEFQSRNLRPECLNFTFEETPEGAFIETIIAAQGELERQQNKRQVIQKMKARMQRGIYCLSHAPYGYVYVKSNVYGGKVLEIDKHDAEIIREAFLGFASGKLFQIKDVADFINTRKTQKTNEIIRRDTIKKMLTNITYAGYLEYHPWEIFSMKGIHESIISLKTFKKIQERLKGRQPQRSRKDMRNDFPLRGYVNCIHCYKPLTASWSTSRTGTKHPYYRCYTKSCIVSGKSISQKQLHTHFKVFIQNLTPKAKIIQMAKYRLLKEVIQKEKNKWGDREKNVRDRNTLDIQISALVGRITTCSDIRVIEVYEKQLSKLNDQKLLLETEIDKLVNIDVKQLEPLTDKAFQPFKTPYITWEKGNYRKRKIIQNMLFNTNLEYEKENGFGTSDNCYVLRLFEQIQAENNQNILCVDKHENNWNQQLLATSEFITTYWDEIIDSIKKCAELAEELEDDEPKYLNAA